MGMYVTYEVTASNGKCFTEEHKTWAEDQFLHCLVKAAQELGLTLNITAYPEWGGVEEINPDEYLDWDTFKKEHELTHSCSVPWDEWWKSQIDFYKKRLS